MTSRAPGSEIVARTVRTVTSRWRLIVDGEDTPSTHRTLGEAKRAAERLHVLPLSWQAVQFDREWVAYPADLELLEACYKSG